ncbi:MAG: H-NS histone family protein [Gammaproteobacteria bacterium]|nr:H-NS histone family protein [Gammaproteobacteria bacterium]MBU1557145.1 H-NS histone family protein [Gammaproteobacteria bacterium]MBU2072351.1 H-NS histone family protein [Gammaproteobacteria bacterium]MBU2183841.1 H-NS histone family protein [Gammaproteobacteria bacterium]MBU2203947.1 H-NS histone family protein [Gammaproteobacteria bacterium]
MSILLDKRELKKAAKELSLVKLTDVINVLNAVLAERQKEVELIAQLEQLAKSQGFTLEQLGYKLNNDVVVLEGAEHQPKADKRPTKPKFKTINKESQYFYVEDGKLQLLRTHTMKKGLQERGIEVVPVSKVDKKYAKQIDGLITEATAQAVENFNAKVAAWNEWAAANAEEILTKK